MTASEQRQVRHNLIKGHHDLESMRHRLAILRVGIPTAAVINSLIHDLDRAIAHAERLQEVLP